MEVHRVLNMKRILLACLFLAPLPALAEDITVGVGGVSEVWTLARIDDPAARSMVRDFLRDSDVTVRQAAIHVTGLWRDKSAIRVGRRLRGDEARLQEAIRPGRLRCNVSRQSPGRLPFAPDKL